jgi:chromosome segregation ATPase
MSVEIHDKLIAILANVEDFKTKEAALKAEKARHVEQIAASEVEVARCNGELDDIRENQLRLRREMDSLKDDLFRREDDEVIIQDDTHTPTEDGAAPETEAKRMWRDRQKQLRTV